MIVFLQLIVMVCAGLAGGAVARRLKLPALVGQIAAGLIVGHTVLGHVWPRVELTLSHESSTRTFVLQALLYIFLFAAGLRLDISQTVRLRRAIACTTIGDLAVPFGVGYGAVVAFPSIWHCAPGRNVTTMAIVVGLALAISAVPVIVGILSDIGMLTSDVGLIIVSAATIEDLVGLFAFSAVAHTWSEAVVTGGLFAAFLAGVLLAPMTKRATVASRMQQLQRVAGGVCAPAYFVSVGQSVDFTINADWKLLAITLAVACVGKIIGGTVGARVGGIVAQGEALAIGFGLNARGAMGIVLITEAMRRDLVSAPVFVAIVFTALITSVISGPAMLLALSRKRLNNPVG